MAGLRNTLAAAIQKSSNTANFAATGTDPSVGNVYMSGGHPIAGAGMFAGFRNSAPMSGAPPMIPPQGFGGPPAAAPAYAPVAAPTVPFGNDSTGGECGKEEVDRLRRELRKADEKANFFRNQIMTLQHQLTSIDKPVMPVNSIADSGEVARLRAELADERAQKQQLLARVQELEQELQANGLGVQSAANMSLGGRSTSSAWGTGAAPLAAMPCQSMPSTAGPQYHPPFQGDPLNPTTNAGGPRRALIIGCDYSGKVGALRAGVSDAQQWARFFMKRCDFSEQDIRLLSDDPALYQNDVNLVATRDNIQRALQWLVARSSIGDQCFFVFCGHGAQIVTEEYAGQKLCENSICPTDVCADGAQPRVVSDTDVHKALMTLPSGVQATLIYDCCHAGQPLDRSGLNYLTDYVSRGRVDYDKLKGHPVLPRFLELSWKVRPQPADAVRESVLRCQAVQWAACTNSQFCVELPIDERSRGAFTYIFITSLLKTGVRAHCEELQREINNNTASLKGRWRLQQDARMVLSRSTTDKQQTFLR
jgi:hypothetical protein